MLKVPRGVDACWFLSYLPQYVPRGGPLLESPWSSCYSMNAPSSPAIQNLVFYICFFFLKHSFPNLSLGHNKTFWFLGRSSLGHNQTKSPYYTTGNRFYSYKLITTIITEFISASFMDWELHRTEALSSLRRNHHSSHFSWTRICLQVTAQSN